MRYQKFYCSMILAQFMVEVWTLNHKSSFQILTPFLINDSILVMQCLPEGPTMTQVLCKMADQYTFQMWSESLDWKLTKDLSCAIAMYIYLLIFVLLVIAFFDVYWILRLILTRLLSKVSISLLLLLIVRPPRTRIILISKGFAKPLSGSWRSDLLTLLDDWPWLFLPHEQWQILQGDGLCQVGLVWRISEFSSPSKFRVIFVIWLGVTIANIIVKILI